MPSYLYCNLIGDRQKIYDVRDEGVTATDVKRSGSSKFLAPDKCNFHPKGENVIIVEQRLKWFSVMVKNDSRMKEGGHTDARPLNTKLNETVLAVNRISAQDKMGPTHCVFLCLGTICA